MRQFEDLAMWPQRSGTNLTHAALQHPVSRLQARHKSRGKYLLAGTRGSTTASSRPAFPRKDLP